MNIYLDNYYHYSSSFRKWLNYNEIIINYNSTNLSRLIFKYFYDIYSSGSRNFNNRMIDSILITKYIISYLKEKNDFNVIYPNSTITDATHIYNLNSVNIFTNISNCWYIKDNATFYLWKLAPIDYYKYLTSNNTEWIVLVDLNRVKSTKFFKIFSKWKQLHSSLNIQYTTINPVKIRIKVNNIKEINSIKELICSKLKHTNNAD